MERKMKELRARGAGYGEEVAFVGEGTVNHVADLADDGDNDPEDLRANDRLREVLAELRHRHGRFLLRAAGSSVQLVDVNDEHRLVELQHHASRFRQLHVPNHHVQLLVASDPGRKSVNS